MGKRREPRTEKNLPVRIFGTDADGQIFSEKVTTVNVSQHGAEISGLKALLKLDDIVGLSHGPNKSQFQIKWIGQAGTPKANHVGLLNLHPDKAFWDFFLPAVAQDEFQGRRAERRKYPRVRCTTSVELHPEDASIIRGNASDLSIGGCYIEMPTPLVVGTKLKVGLWLGTEKVWATGLVTNSTPGFGVGVKFAEIADADTPRIAEFLKTVKDR
jgi:PilZ domain